MKKILITGGAGFIGSHVVEHFASKYTDYEIVVIDSLTYAANKEFFNTLEDRFSNVTTFRIDIRDIEPVNMIVGFGVTDIIHLAAESHVDNSINDPNIFVETNVMGTVNLLNAAKNTWGDEKNHLFYHVSTDEVYGALGSEGYFTEGTAYDPKSPYSASKAASDHFVRAYGNTYGLNYIISNCSNNYGERQHPEKLLPKTINNILQGKKVPVYGKGENIRDWLYVGDHVAAIDLLFHKGTPKETYLIGGDSEINNLSMVRRIIQLINDMIRINPKHIEDDVIEFVEDRKGHDFRYAIDHSKITKQLGWKPEHDLSEGLIKTIRYYWEKKYVNNSR